MDSQKLIPALQKAIEEAEAPIISGILNGVGQRPVEDARLAGRILGMHDALKMADEIIKEFNDAPGGGKVKIPYANPEEDEESKENEQPYEV